MNAYASYDEPGIVVIEGDEYTVDQAETALRTLENAISQAKALADAEGR